MPTERSARHSAQISVRFEKFIYDEAGRRSGVTTSGGFRAERMRQRHSALNLASSEVRRLDLSFMACTPAGQTRAPLASLNTNALSLLPVMNDQRPAHLG